MMKDPICGMEVDEKSKFRSSYKNKTYVFCSANCKQNFDKDPGSHAKS